MRTKDRETLRRDAGTRLERMLARMAKFAGEGPAVPSLPRNANLSALRRTAARLRSGAMQPADPSLHPQAAAGGIDPPPRPPPLLPETLPPPATHPPSS